MKVHRQRSLVIIPILLLAQLFHHPACARRILIWRILARTNRSILKSDWTGNLLTTSIDAFIRAKTQQQENLQFGSHRPTPTTGSRSTNGSAGTTVSASVNESKPQLSGHRGGAVVATSHHHSKNSIVDRIRAILVRVTSKTPFLASPWTMGVVVTAVTVAYILRRWHPFSYPGVTLEDWELMCRDQLPEFWKTEVLPLLESDHEEHCRDGRLAKILIRKTRPLMKQRIQLAEQVSTILGNHLKTRKPLTPSEKDSLATYYAEITVEKLNSVTEGLRQKLDRANNSNNSSDQPKTSATRYLSDRSKIIEGLVQRIRTFMEGDAILLDETALREYFKEALREAIVVVPGDDGNDEESPTSSSSEHEQDICTEEPVTAENHDPTTNTTLVAATTVLQNDDGSSEGQPTSTMPKDFVEHEQ